MFVDLPDAMKFAKSKGYDEVKIQYLSDPSKIRTLPTYAGGGRVIGTVNKAPNNIVKGKEYAVYRYLKGDGFPAKYIGLKNNKYRFELSEGSIWEYDKSDFKEGWIREISERVSTYAGGGEINLNDRGSLMDYVLKNNPKYSDYNDFNNADDEQMLEIYYDTVSLKNTYSGGGEIDPFISSQTEDELRSQLMDTMDEDDVNSMTREEVYETANESYLMDNFQYDGDGEIRIKAVSLLKSAMKELGVDSRNAVHTTIYSDGIENIELQLSDGNDDLAKMTADEVAGSLYNKNFAKGGSTYAGGGGVKVVYKSNKSYGKGYYVTAIFPKGMSESDVMDKGREMEVLDLRFSPTKVKDVGGRYEIHFGASSYSQTKLKSALKSKLKIKQGGSTYQGGGELRRIG